MNLKNYTTEVPAVRSQEYIERLLVQFGAHNIMKEYIEVPHLPGKRCGSLSFIIDIGDQKLPFKLDPRIAQVTKWLRKKKPNSSDKNIAEQAERIAWKQQYEMLYLQLGQIEISQLETLEVFFPYLYDFSQKKTYYEKMKENKFRALLSSPQ